MRLAKAACRLFSSSAVEQHALAPAYKKVFEELSSRGLVYQTTGDWSKWGLKQSDGVYCGVDPTASSLHVGHLNALIVLKHFQMAGIPTVALVGGATAVIGDPTGRSTERPIIPKEELDRNIGSLRGQINSLLNEDPITAEGVSHSTRILNNATWFGAMSVLDFFGPTGCARDMRIAAMMSRDSVQSRMSSRSPTSTSEKDSQHGSSGTDSDNDHDEGLSLSEFCYQAFQGYDFLHLYRNEGVKLQIGGSDQWGNIVAGTSLIRRSLHRIMSEHDSGEEANVDVQGMTMPLLTDAAGQKMGKTSGGKAVWLDADRVSPFQFYQYWLQVRDDDVEKMMKRLTFIHVDDIKQIVVEHEKEAHLRKAQKKLAEELTTFVHGPAAMKRAQVTTDVLYNDVTSVSAFDIITHCEGVKRMKVEKQAFLTQELATTLKDGGMVASKGEARRLMKEGGLSVSGQKVTDGNATGSDAHLIEGAVAVVKMGKKRYALVEMC